MSTSRLSTDLSILGENDLEFEEQTNLLFKDGSDIQHNTTVHVANTGSVYGSISQRPEEEEAQPPCPFPAAAMISSISTTNFSVILLCVFIGDMTRGLIFPTMWLYVKALGGNKLSQVHADTWHINCYYQ